MILNYNNLLIKESISNFQRILHLLIQNKFEEKTITNKINLELDDIAVISDYIQFNFDRLDDLKENINSKITGNGLFISGINLIGEFKTAKKC